MKSVLRLFSPIKRHRKEQYSFSPLLYFKESLETLLQHMLEQLVRHSSVVSILPRSYLTIHIPHSARQYSPLLLDRANLSPVSFPVSLLLERADVLAASDWTHRRKAHLFQTERLYELLDHSLWGIPGLYGIGDPTERPFLCKKTLPNKNMNLEYSKWSVSLGRILLALRLRI